MSQQKRDSRRRQAIETMADDAQRSLTNARRFLEEGFHVFAHVEGRAAFSMAVLVAHRRFASNPTTKGGKKFDVAAAIRDMRHKTKIKKELANDLLESHRIAVMGGHGEGDTALMIESTLELLNVSQGGSAKHQSGTKIQRRRPGFRRLTAAASTLLALVIR